MDNVGTTRKPTVVLNQNTDAFGRLRVSEPYTLFDAQNRYEANNKKFFSNIVGTANVGYIYDESTVTMNVDASANSSVIRQSKYYFSYQPGKSLFVLCTFCMNPPKTNLVQRVGYFDNLNGIFLERDGAGVFIVKRNAGTDTRVAQTDWNISSLCELDLSKVQIFFMDIEWLGVGSVRTGFIIDGVYRYAHTFHHANKISSVYMTTAILPVRYHIFNSNTTSSPSTLKQICASVISEGGYQPSTALTIQDRPVYTLAIANTVYPLISIRLASSRLGSVVFLKQIDLLVTTKDSGTWYLLYNPTLTTASWQPHLYSNIIEYDTSSTSLSGGTIINTGYFSEISEVLFDIQSNITLGLTDINTSDIITIAAASTSPNSVIASKIGWIEI